MKFQIIALIVLLGITSNSWSVSAQDVVFPGQTERPSHIPTKGPTGFPGSQPTQRPTALPTTRPTQPNLNIAAYNACIDRCLTTSEYNPVCGSDGVVYTNPGSLTCAQKCGNPVIFVRYGQCNAANQRG